MIFVCLPRQALFCFWVVGFPRALLSKRLTSGVGWKLTSGFFLGGVWVSPLPDVLVMFLLYNNCLTIANKKFDNMEEL